MVPPAGRFPVAGMHETGATAAPDGTVAIGRWSVRRAGYGAMQLAGDGVFGPVRDHSEALLVLRAALAAGVNHIDTAQYYGTANRLIREALHPYPPDLAIVSKLAAQSRDDSGSLPYDASGELRRGIEENLETLQIPRLAAVNLRLMDPADAPGRRFDAQLAALIRVRDEGLVDGIGLSNISSHHLARALEQTDIVCVQNLFNLADQRSLDVLMACQEHGIAFAPFCPLGWPGETHRRIITHPALVAVAARLDATPVQLALAWLIDRAPNVLLIPGTRTRTHLAENLGAVDVRLDDDARSDLEMMSRRLTRAGSSRR